MSQRGKNRYDIKVQNIIRTILTLLFITSFLPIYSSSVYAQTDASPIQFKDTLTLSSLADPSGGSTLEAVDLETQAILGERSIFSYANSPFNALVILNQEDDYFKEYYFLFYEDSLIFWMYVDINSAEGSDMGESGALIQEEFTQQSFTRSSNQNAEVILTLALSSKHIGKTVSEVEFVANGEWIALEQLINNANVDFPELEALIEQEQLGIDSDVEVEEMNMDDLSMNSEESAAYIQKIIDDNQEDVTDYERIASINDSLKQGHTISQLAMIEELGPPASQSTEQEVTTLQYLSVQSDKLWTYTYTFSNEELIIWSIEQLSPDWFEEVTTEEIALIIESYEKDKLTAELISEIYGEPTLIINYPLEERVETIWSKSKSNSINYISLVSTKDDYIYRIHYNED